MTTARTHAAPVPFSFQGRACGTIEQCFIHCPQRGFGRKLSATACTHNGARIACCRGKHVAPAQLRERRNPVSMCHLWRKPVAKPTLATLTQGRELIPLQNVIYTYCG
jgi:hypothetical protein